jgi:hypothetical protein
MTLQNSGTGSNDLSQLPADVRALWPASQSTKFGLKQHPAGGACTCSTQQMSTCYCCQLALETSGLPAPSVATAHPCVRLVTMCGCNYCDASPSLRHSVTCWPLPVLLCQQLLIVHHLLITIKVITSKQPGTCWLGGCCCCCGSWGC